MVFTKVVAITCMMMLSSISLAAQYVVNYTDTIGASSTAPFISGEPFSVSIVLDNGGSSTASQTWTTADVVSITFSMNNAPSTISTVLSPVVFTSSNGSFVTDATGTLTAVPTSMIDGAQLSTVLSTNDNMALYTDFEWYINGLNPVYFDQSDSSPAAYMTSVGNNVIPDFWSAPAINALAAPTSVPTLSQWSTILLTLILLTFGLFKARRFK